MKNQRCGFKQSRQINIAPRKISKQSEARQFYCMRGVIRKHSDVSWRQVASFIKRHSWEGMMFDTQYANFGGFSKEEKNDTNIIRFSFRIMCQKDSSVKKEISFLKEK